MTNTIWLAQLIGPVVLATSTAMIVRPASVQALTQAFLASPPIIFVSGVLVMIAGLAIINTHNLWVMGWPVIVTLFGWALLLGGISRIVLPDVVQNVGQAMVGGTTMTRAMGVAWGALGLFLCVKAYV